MILRHREIYEEWVKKVMKKKGEKGIEKNGAAKEIGLLLPILFFTTVFLFCVRGRIVPTYLTDFFWFTKGEYVGNLYAYFRAQMLIAVTAMAVLYLLYCVLSGKVKVEKHKIYIPMAIYALMVILSYAFSEYKEIAWMGFESRYEGTLVLLCYMLLLFYAMHAVKSENGVKLVVKCFGVACFLLGIWGIMQLCGIRLDSIPAWVYMSAEMQKYGSLSQEMVVTAVNWFFSNQNYTSFFMVFPICIFAMSCIGMEDMKKKLLYAALTGLMMFSLWQSASLGGMVGFAVAVVVALVTAGGENLVKWKKSIGLLLLAGILSVGASLPVIMQEVGSSAAMHMLLGIRTAYAEEPNEAPLRFSEIENIITDGAAVTFEFAEGPITISVENDEINSITDGTGAPVSADNGLLKAYTTVHEEAGYTLLQVDTLNKTWTFAIVENVIYFVTPSGSLINLDKVEHTGFEGNEDFATYRGYIWSRTFPLLKETVLLGKGADTYAIYFPQDDYAGRYNIGYYTNGQNVIIDKPHNMYLGAAVNTGVISMLALIAVYGLYIIESFKLYRKHQFTGYKDYIGMAIFIAVAGFMVSALVNDSTVQMMPVVYVLLGMGLAINKMVIHEKRGQK